jgi:hypothetical protein
MESCQKFILILHRESPKWRRYRYLVGDSLQIQDWIHELLRLMLKLKFSILNMTRWPHIVKLKR